MSVKTRMKTIQIYDNLRRKQNGGNGGHYLEIKEIRNERKTKMNRKGAHQLSREPKAN